MSNCACGFCWVDYAAWTIAAIAWAWMLAHEFFGGKP